MQWCSRLRCSITPRPTSAVRCSRASTLVHGRLRWSMEQDCRVEERSRTVVPRSKAGLGLSPGRPGLVQPVPRRRPGRPEARLRSGSRRSSRCDRRRRQVEGDRPVLELRHALRERRRRRRRLPEDDALRPACDRDLRRHRVYIGNDGGVLRRSRRPVARAPRHGWSEPQLRTSRTLQYYCAGLGQEARSRAVTAVWGGLQDNGESLLAPGATHDGLALRRRRR